MSFDFSEFSEFSSTLPEYIMDEYAQQIEEEVLCPICSSKLTDCRIDFENKKGTCNYSNCGTIQINIEAED